MVKSLIDSFWHKQEELCRATAAGAEADVVRLDSEIQPLLNAILEVRCSDPCARSLQMVFLADLIRAHAQDASLVIDHADRLEQLVRRDAVTDSRSSGAGRSERVGEGGVEQIGIDLVLDALPDRVAIITCDYRYLYSNAANARHLGVKPLQLIGRHLVEFVGETLFADRIRGHLDKCFLGETADYVTTREFQGRMIRRRCRMIPFRHAHGSPIVGAVILLQDLSDLPAVLYAA
ncbi:hypothetical protein BJF93_00690 [Xaviernesmea oryzae]|uniref:PAS fold-4 domain-containing protein n=1 Tax=Xaviernesmea oryzae TaxID=464029 RepID=A0A1Q9B0H6_9HYPH|nr:PAS domain-containing protein [Xaviernesmea oryzae]OLP61485.1 hypothetical protein BJF93_00690 [Xaviernesmea oryzae]SEL67842.1 PAS fold-containing protein [Xaviernesmea oryzae]